MKTKFINVLTLFLLILVVKCRPNQDKVKLEVHKTSNGTIGSLIYSNQKVRDTWSIIVQFRYASNSYFLFYDRSNGQIEISDINFRLIQSLPGIKKCITKITAIDINNDGNDELFFFSPGEIFGLPGSMGTGEFYAVTGQFQLNLLKTNNTYRNYWKDIVAFDFDNDGRKELLFYDPTDTYKDSCSAKMYSVGDNCALSLINNFFWEKNWKIIVPVHIGTSKGVLRYNGHNGNIELLNYNSLKHDFSLLSNSPGYSPDIDKIIPGSFGLKDISGFLFYEKRNGKGTFYTIQNNTLQKTGESLNFRKVWENIVPYQKYNSSNDYLMFYQRQLDMELSIPTYDGSGQAVHPDILKMKENDYRLAFTPYPWGKDTFENPSILESSDGIHFQKIPNTKNNPLVFHPVYQGYELEHNDDPDYYFENTNEYIIYQETFQLKGSNPRILDQNLVLLSSCDHWATFKSSNILTERNTKNPYSISVSPALIKKDGIFYLFYVNASSNGVNPTTSKIQFLTSNVITNWNFIRSPNNGYNIKMNSTIKMCPWHIDVILNPYDRNYYMLITGKTGRYSSTGNSLYLAKSYDLVNWELYPKPIIIKEEIHHANQIYRSSGIFRDFTIMDIYYSYPTKDWFWHIDLRNNYFASNKSWHINLRKNYSIRGLFPSNNEF